MLKDIAGDISLAVVQTRKDMEVGLVWVFSFGWDYAMFESIGVYFMLMMFISFPSDTDGRSRVQSVILGSSLFCFFTL